MEKLKKCVEILINRASEAKTALDALQFSQSACNLANAIVQLQHIKNCSGSENVEKLQEK